MSYAGKKAMMISVLLMVRRITGRQRTGPGITPERYPFVPLMR
jgi:hypothetical protein